MIKKLLLMGVTFIGISNAYASSSPYKVDFHESRPAREWKIIDSDLYHPFISKHNDISIYSSVVDLDGKGTGSIIIQFRSPETCNSSGCVTTIVNYDKIHQTWREVLNHRTTDIWIGSISPTNAGDGMKEVFTSDGLMWRWIGRNSYHPEVRSLGTLWPDSVVSFGQRRDFALNNMPEEIPNEYKHGDYIINEIPIDLTGFGGQYLIEYNYMPICSMSGCPFIVIDKNGSGYSVKAHGIINELGVTIKNNDKSIPYSPFAVQVGDGIAYYGYNKGNYKLVKTTYSSNVTRTP